jgi:HD-like signal output (HDOD) protein
MPELSPAERAEIARGVAEQIKKLPPMPETVIRLREEARRPSANFKTLVPLLERDPGLSADLLRFANSAAYGIPHRVDTVSEAVLYFGMRNLVEFIAVSFSNRIIRQTFSRLKNIDDYFGHSQRVSLACHVLAQDSGQDEHRQEVAKLGGLLHNIGRLVVLLVTNQDGAELTGAAWDGAKEVRWENNNMCGIDHCNVGAEICRKWEFPDLLQEAIFLGELMVIDDLPGEIINEALPAWALDQLRLSPGKLDAARGRFRALRDKQG